MLVSSVFFAALSAVPGAPGRRVEVQGHRGARAVLPENTLEAFTYAIEVGADVIELDLAVTKDDRLAVVHDLYVNRELYLGPDGKKITSDLSIRSLTAAELKGFDCGTLPHPRFLKQKRIAGARIPTLDEVFELVRTSKHPNAKRIRFNIETKSEPAHPELTPSPERFAQLVVEAVKKHGMWERTVVQSFDPRTIVAAKKLEPKLRIALLHEPSAGAPRRAGLALPPPGPQDPDRSPRYVEMVKAVNADILSPHHEWITKEAVDALHAAGVSVVPWTANDEAAWARLGEMGVDGIITDDPAALIEFLKKRKLR